MSKEPMMFLKKHKKKDWDKGLGDYQAATLQYLARRPKCFPTLEDSQYGGKDGKRVRNLLARERRRVRKVHHLLDKLTDAVEKGKSKQADEIDIQVSDTVIEIIDIWLKLNKKFRQESARKK